MPVKTVTLSEDAYAALAALKREGESFSEVVRRLTRTGRSLLEFAGAWKDFPSEKMDRYLAFLEAGERPAEGETGPEEEGGPGRETGAGRDTPIPLICPLGAGPAVTF